MSDEGPDHAARLAVLTTSAVPLDPCTSDLVDPTARSLAASPPGVALLERLHHLDAGIAGVGTGVVVEAGTAGAGAGAKPDGVRDAVADDPDDPDDPDDAALIETVAACDRLIAHVVAIQVRATALFARRRRAEAQAYAALHPVAFARGLASSAAVEELSARRRTSRWAGQRDLDAAELVTARPAVHAALAAGTLDPARAVVIATAAAGVAPEHADALVASVLPGAHLVRLEAVRERVRRAAWRLDPASARQAAAVAAAERTVCLVRQVRAADGVGGGGRAVLEVDGPAPQVLTVQAAIEARALALRRREREAAVAEARVERSAPMSAWRFDALVDIAHGVLEGHHGPVARSAASHPVVHVTVPAATLLGLSEEPGLLAGFGAIPADQARAVAADGLWRRVLTDPAGRALEIGERTYRPSAHLAALVRSDHPACSAPWCGRDARRCDLDHVVPWPRGATERGNLHPACPRDHRLKHSGLGVAVERESDGRLVHVTRTGHRYGAGGDEPHDEDAARPR